MRKGNPQIRRQSTGDLSQYCKRLNASCNGCQILSEASELPQKDDEDAFVIKEKYLVEVESKEVEKKVLAKMATNWRQYQDCL